MGSKCFPNILVVLALIAMAFWVLKICVKLLYSGVILYSGYLTQILLFCVNKMSGSNVIMSSIVQFSRIRLLQPMYYIIC